jgi:hypothetical protein
MDAILPVSITLDVSLVQYNIQRANEGIYYHSISCKRPTHYGFAILMNKYPFVAVNMYIMTILSGYSEKS